MIPNLLATIQPQCSVFLFKVQTALHMDGEQELEASKT